MIILESKRTIRPWQQIKSEIVRPAYQEVHDKLVSDQKGKGRIGLCVTYLAAYVATYNLLGADNNLPDHLAYDLTPLVTGNDNQRAQDAWVTMQRHAGWTPAHRDRVQGHISRALSVCAPGLSKVVNPGMRARSEMVVLRNERSHMKTYVLHDCIPLKYRRMSVNDSRYRTLQYIGKEFARHSRSVSKGYMQSTLAFLARIICSDPQPLVDAGDSYEAIVGRLRQMDAKAWLRRYEYVQPNAERVAFPTFKGEMRLLRTLHCRILQPGARLVIPAPVFLTVQREEGYSSSTHVSYGSTGSSQEDERLRLEQRSLLSLLESIQRRVCQEKEEDLVEEERDYAFRVDEVRSILGACVTALQRLTVLLFLTTGMRIGGLCRLRLPETLMPAAMLRPADVPSATWTVEKNGVRRDISLTPAVRILAFQWLKSSERVAVESPYMFPSPLEATRNVCTRTVWKACRSIFIRAGVSGKHVHPHTFRHTLVHMLFITGNSFAKIAKFIGHRSEQTTAQRYGRLRHTDTINAIQGVGFLQDAQDSTARQEWETLAHDLTDPYRFAGTGLWDGLPGAKYVDKRKRRSDTLTRTHDALKHNVLSA